MGWREEYERQSNDNGQRNAAPEGGPEAATEKEAQRDREGRNSSQYSNGVGAGQAGPDKEQTVNALETLCDFDRGVVELRIPNADRNITISGWFSNASKLAEEALKWDSASGIYFTLNPVKPDVGARKPGLNQVARNSLSTSDKDILAHDWLPLDFDPVRPTGVSSTDIEHGQAIQLAMEVQQWLTSLGWPAPVIGDSGNGAHLLYRISLPAKKESADLLRSVLEAISFKFTDEKVQVDRTVFNAARIWKLYGTVARKGMNTPERPHRLSSLMAAPEQIEEVSVEQINALVRQFKPPEEPRLSGARHHGDFDLSRWIGEHALDVRREGRYGNGDYRWILKSCPWDETHKDAALIKWSSGAVFFKCFHDTCYGRGWKEFRLVYEPDAYQKKEQQSNHQTFNMGEDIPPPPKRRGQSAMKVKPEKVEWLWPGYIPLGKICDIQGDPGQGKSAITADLAAIISSGGTWPTGDKCEPAGVIMVSGEDDLADTIVPRLIAAGADRSRIYTFTLQDEILFELPRDFDLLGHKCRELKVRAIILDPLDCFVSDEIDTNKNQSIRKLLAMLAHLADEITAAVIVVRHLNKDAKTKTPMYRGGGSIGMNAASRQVFMIGPAPDDDTLHVLAHVKGNCGPAPSSLGYRLEGVTLKAYPEIETVRVNWVGEVNIPAWQLLEEPDIKAKKQANGEKLKHATYVLREILSDGLEHDANEIEATLKREGITHATLWRAKQELGVKGRQKGFHGGWLWTLPLDFTP